ncbi:hypothetical protein QAD02_018072 [Eretmocerus hayati]|uniref:Uncharacterized protein n=1 Tax=Eretmocerus hayati TaxID=131215 RepID=A0ACC2PFS6_9HYME|nr:hypothetical protein QAD02_018072 [Eretmocerus hayati]
MQGSMTEAKARMNEAMRRIEKLAGKEGHGDKTELLREFLDRKKTLIERRETDADRESLLLMRMQERKDLPQVDGKVNEFLRCCSDAVDLSHDKEKGRLLRATRNIRPGAVLIVDKPYSFCTNVEVLHTNCLNCHTSLRFRDTIRVPCKSCRTVQFCSDTCRKQAWDAFHRYECRIFDYFCEKSSRRTNSSLAYRTLVNAALQSRNNSVEINQNFLKLHHDDKNALDVKSLEKYESQDYKTVFTLETHCNRTNVNDNLEKTIHSIFFAKCLIFSLHFLELDTNDFERHLHVLAVALLHNMQSINCNAYEIVENVRNDETKVLEPRTVGGAIYTSVSLTNHSCYPNIVRHTYPCGTVVVRSTRFIPRDSEILDCYGQHFLENDRHTRRKLLAQKYHFICQCEACLHDWPAKLPSDEFHFKCKKCFKQCRQIRKLVECTSCGFKTEMSKLCITLQNSVRNRLTALTKMYDGSYRDALPLLLEQASNIDKLLLEPSLEAAKTQQSIIQCFNAMSCTSI